MTTGRINQIAVRVFARRHITSSKLMRRRARRKSNPLAGVTKPESQRSSNRERLDGPRSRPSGVGGRKWSPTAGAHRLPSRCFFQNRSTRTVSVRCVLQTRIAVRRGERKTKELSPQVLTARCTFGCGPFAVSKGKDTIRRRACPNRTQRRPAGLASCTTCLPSADGGLSDCFPKRAQSPSTKSCPLGLHWAGGLVRLVLRCVVLVHIV